MYKSPSVSSLTNLSPQGSTQINTNTALNFESYFNVYVMTEAAVWRSVAVVLYGVGLVSAVAVIVADAKSPETE